jgi:hypothetical protein
MVLSNINGSWWMVQSLARPMVRDRDYREATDLRGSNAQQTLDYMFVM